MGEGLIQPTRIALDKYGDIYVGDNGSNRIVEFAANTHEFLTELDLVGGSSLANITSVGVDQQGRIYVADAGNNRIQKFAP